MSPSGNSLFPVLTTADLERALRFYRDRLGGAVVYQFPPAGEPVFVSLDVGSGHLGIGAAETAIEGPQRIALWIDVDDCDTSVAVLRGGGVEVVEEPLTQPWGERVARVLDPDGNSVFIASGGSG